MTNISQATPPLAEVLANPNPRTHILGVKVNVECRTCGHTWGTYLDTEGRLPFKWDFCIECSKKRKDAAKAHLAGIDEQEKS